MPSLTCRSLLLFMLVGLTGCAGLTARKVPLNKRLCGTDGRINGFRYYLSRPYMSVNNRIPVVSHDELGVLMMASGETSANTSFQMPVMDGAAAADSYAIRTIGTDGSPLYVDLSGQPIPYAARDLDMIYAPVYRATSVEPADDNSEDGANTVNRILLGIPATSNFMQQDDDSDDDGADAAPEIPGMSVFFLPDFEQQMAVKHCNILAQGNFSMSFVDGWQLKSVNGSFDSTEVVVSVIQTLKNAITQATDLRAERIEARMGAANGEDQGNQNLVPPSRDGMEVVRVIIRRSSYIEPGVYRLSKPSEQSGATGIGLLANMGLPVREDTQILLLSDDPVVVARPARGAPVIGPPVDGQKPPAPPTGDDQGTFPGSGTTHAPESSLLTPNPLNPVAPNPSRLNAPARQLFRHSGKNQVNFGMVML